MKKINVSLFNPSWDRESADDTPYQMTVEEIRSEPGHYQRITLVDGEPTEVYGSRISEKQLEEFLESVRVRFGADEVTMAE